MTTNSKVFFAPMSPILERPKERTVMSLTAPKLLGFLSAYMRCGYLGLARVQDTRKMLMIYNIRKARREHRYLQKVEAVNGLLPSLGSAQLYLPKYPYNSKVFRIRTGRLHLYCMYAPTEYL